MFDLDSFIKKYVIKRSESMFLNDIQDSSDELHTGIEGKRILVIGGAGSIGSSFVKTILPYHPQSLIIADINENALAELTRDLRSTEGMYVPEDYIPYPMDYSSRAFERMFCDRKGFDIVANFSAHKHVRSEKDIYSVEALLQNNVLHARHLLDLLAKYPPQKYFCVSTDKAANPVNIMGASKRLMEDLIFAYSDRFPVSTARFANVAFSNGSLPAGFLSRMQKFQPISAPTDVRRYFVSPEESGQICMLSCIVGNNREIFFPKLEEAQMMGFDTIASRLIEAHGYEVMMCNSDAEAIAHAENLKKGSRQYPVHFSGSDTSGEKKYEEFYTDAEQTDLLRFNSLGVVIGKGIPDKECIQTLMNQLEAVFERPDINKAMIVDMIGNYLPSFGHIETGKSLDSKM